MTVAAKCSVGGHTHVLVQGLTFSEHPSTGKLHVHASHDGKFDERMYKAQPPVECLTHLTPYGCVRVLGHEHANRSSHHHVPAITARGKKLLLQAFVRLTADSNPVSSSGD